MPLMMDPTYVPNPKPNIGGGLGGLYPPMSDPAPRRPLLGPISTPRDPSKVLPIGNDPSLDPNDPRNDPRNIRARRARENPLLTPPPPPPPTMSYGPALGAPTASLSAGGGGMPNPAPWGKAPMLPGHGIMYPKPLVSIPQWGGGGPSVGFRTPTGLSPQRPKLF